MNADRLTYLMVGLMKWRLILQWVGAFIMIPAVVLGTAVNFGWLDSAFAMPALIGVGVAMIPLLGSVVCTLTYHGIRNNLIKQSLSRTELERIKSAIKEADEAEKEAREG